MRRPRGRLLLGGLAVASLAALAVGAPAGAKAAASGQRTLVFLATTDQHGHLEQAPLLGAVVARERKLAPGRVVLVDGGDIFQGTLASNIGEGQAMVRAFNALGYDAAAIGNHEFDFGPVGADSVPRSPADDPRGALKARIAEAKFPLLSANVLGADGAPAFKPYTIVRVGGVQVGIVGGTAEDTPRSTNPRNLVGLTIAPLAPQVARFATEARRHGATVVVAVVHAGGRCTLRGPLSDSAPGDTHNCEENADLFRLARDLKALAAKDANARVDAIFGGHSHQGVTAVVEGTPVAQAFANGGAIAKLELEVDGAGKPTGHFTLAPLERVEKTLTPDAKVAGAVAADLQKVEAMRAQPVGVTLSERLWRAYKTESPLGNFVADEIRAATGSDVALTNGGGLRADLPAGPLTYGALFEALPFDNRLAVIRLPGAALRRLLASNLASDKGVLVISGGRIDARCDNGALVVDITLASGEKVSDTRPVVLGTTDFLAAGGDDFAPVVRSLPAGAVELRDSPALRDVIVEQLKKAGTRELRPSDPSLWDPAHRRLNLSSARPIRCK